MRRLPGREMGAVRIDLRGGVRRRHLDARQRAGGVGGHRRRQSHAVGLMGTRHRGIWHPLRAARYGGRPRLRATADKTARPFCTSWQPARFNPLMTSHAILTTVSDRPGMLYGLSNGAGGPSRPTSTYVDIHGAIRIPRSTSSSPCPTTTRRGGARRPARGRRRGARGAKRRPSAGSTASGSS